MDSGNSKTDAQQDIEFEHLDVVPGTEDHHYLSSNKSDKAMKCLNDNNAPLYSTIMKEWKILKKTLPDSIYVQAYETRIDLLRAVIIGPPGTPYHDGLFFFDILLPSDYPKTPPKLHYHAHGYRLNPNLYAHGRVCLSLINTWFGRKVEKWTKNSTVLQILVSIQGLVLNERPYFNEPGSGTSKECKASIKYNENAFVLSCFTMLKIMKKPPMGFELFVARHFQERRGSIVEAIEAYQAGRVLVGKFGVNDLRVASSFKVSPLFKKNLGVILAHFGVRVDVKNGGISSSGSESGKKVKADQQNVEKKKKKGVLKRVGSIVKWLFK